MHEIIFRGKRKDNGEWVYGDLYHDWNRLYTKPDIKIANNMGKFPVIPETVGQYTGLTDKNGKKIFDGDIIRHYNDVRNPENFDTYIIQHDEGRSRFVGYLHKNWSAQLCCLLFLYSDLRDKYEIISNIHDNPVLLEK